MRWKQWLIVLLFPFSWLMPANGLHSEYIWDTAFRNLEKFGQQLAKKNQLVYLNRGLGILVDNRDVALAISLMGRQKLTIEETRPLIVGMVQEFINLMKSDPTFEAYMQETHKHTSWYDPVMSPKRIGIKVSFWDANVDRYPPPYVSQVKVKEGKIFYYQTKSDSQFLDQPFSETFEEAFALVRSSK